MRYIDHLCTSKAPGVTILFHPSGQLPDLSREKFSVQTGELTAVDIQPKVTRVSEGLAKVSPNKYVLITL